MAIPDWLNRETVQLTLVVLITLVVHYFFITQKFQEAAMDKVGDLERELDLNEQQQQEANQAQ